MQVAGLDFDIAVVRHRRARRYVLRMPAVGVLRLTVPRGASVAAGYAFVERQAAWIAREDHRQRELASPWGDGTVVMLRGEPCALRVDGDVILLGDQAIKRAEGANRAEGTGQRAEGARRAEVRELVERHLRAMAASELAARCLALAAEKRLAPTGVTVRNQRTRWGSCSARGRIALNWRLVQMPPSVSDYVILHELAHLKHQNHSRAFWREVERLCPEWRDAERWIRAEGRGAPAGFGRGPAF